MPEVSLVWSTSRDLAQQVTAALERYELAHLIHPERQAKKEAEQHPQGIYAIRARGKVVGGLTFYVHNDWVFLLCDYVRESWRGSGLYRRMLEDIEGRVRDLGLSGIFVSTYDFEAPALYEHLGFKRGAEMPNCPRGNTSIDFFKVVAV